MLHSPLNMTVISLRSTIISQYGISRKPQITTIRSSIISATAISSSTENIVLTLKDKIDCLDSLHRYKDAYEAYKEYSVLLDSARTRSMENKVEDLEIKKHVDELVVEKKALEIDLQKSRSQLYLFLALLILSISFGIFIFFRLLLHSFDSIL